jgi:hypothetical protein
MRVSGLSVEVILAGKSQRLTNKRFIVFDDAPRLIVHCGRTRG